MCQMLPEGGVWASERMAVCRATDHQDQDPGKYIVDERSARSPGGQEVTVKQFDMLAVCEPGLFEQVDCLAS